jgi:hypothetical protein
MSLIEKVLRNRSMRTILSVMQDIPFPRFKPYDEFQNERIKAIDIYEKQFVDTIMNKFMEGKAILQKLIDLEES